MLGGKWVWVSSTLHPWKVGLVGKVARKREGIVVDPNPLANSIPAYKSTHFPRAPIIAIVTPRSKGGVKGDGVGGQNGSGFFLWPRAGQNHLRVGGHHDPLQIVQGVGGDNGGVRAACGCDDVV
jgi:hypothetical protein